MAKCIGLMARYTKDSGSTEPSMERVRLYFLMELLKKAFSKTMSFKRSNIKSLRL